MTAGDVMILLVLTVLLVFIFRQMRKDRKKSCNGDCAHCHQVDWNEVRRELHKERKPGLRLSVAAIEGIEKAHSGGMS